MATANSTGVECSEWGNVDCFVGTADALITAGVITAAQLPGAPGRNKTCVTFNAAPKLRDAGPDYLQIQKLSGRQYRVFRGLPREEYWRREAAYNARLYELADKRLREAEEEHQGAQQALLSELASLRSEAGQNRANSSRNAPYGAWTSMSAPWSLLYQIASELQAVAEHRNANDEYAITPAAKEWILDQARALMDGHTVDVVPLDSGTPDGAAARARRVRIAHKDLGFRRLLVKLNEPIDVDPDE